MNILFYMHQFPGVGGMETIAATLAKEFVRRGHEVSFLSHCASKRTSIMTQLPPCIECFKMPDVKHLVSNANRIFLKEIVLRKKIETILYRDSYAEIEGNVLRIGVFAKIITSEHSAPFFCHTEAHPEAYTLRRKIVDVVKRARIHSPYYYEGRRKRFLYENSDVYVLLSDRFFGEFKAMARLFDTRKLRAINNPLAPELEPTCVNLDSKENLMVFVATLSSEKGVMRALEALNILKCNGHVPPGWRFEILGDGVERSKCENYIKEHCLDFVKVLGYVSNPQPFFERAKLLLFPSSREGFGNVLFEAQANGCVPIAFASYSSIFDIVHHGEDGLLVDAFDVKKYAQAIKLLLTDQGTWRAMAQKATKAVDRFSVAKIADQWEALLKEVSQSSR